MNKAVIRRSYSRCIAGGFSLLVVMKGGFTYYTFFRNGKPVDAEETVLAAILLPESEFSRGGKRSSSC